MKVIPDFSSEAFISKLKQRDPEVITLVVQSFTEDLLKGAKGLGFKDSMAEELVQNVWVTFFDIVKDFQGRSQIKTFLFGIMYNKASELRRENAKFEKHDPIENLMGFPNFSRGGCG